MYNLGTSYSALISESSNMFQLHIHTFHSHKAVRGRGYHHVCPFLRGMTKTLRFREGGWPARGAQQASQTPAWAPDPRAGQGGDREMRGRWELWGGAGRAATPSPGGPAPTALWPDLAPGGFPRAAARRRRGAVLRGRPGIGAGSPSPGAGQRALLQHGTPAAHPGALLRCAVPLLLVGLRGDSGSSLGRGLEGKGRGKGGSGTRGPWSREIPGAARWGLGSQG